MRAPKQSRQEVMVAEIADGSGHVRRRQKAAGFQLCSFLAVCPRADCLTSLGLYFLI